MRVLLLTYYYAPSNAMGAARTTSLAEYLAARGDEVHVIASSSGDAAPAKGSDPNGVTVERLRDQGGVVTRAFAKFSGHPSTTRTAVQVLATSQGLGAKALQLASFMGRSFLHVPDPSLTWAHEAFNISIKATQHWRPDVIVASGPPFSTFIAASRLSRRLKVPWVADYRDLWSNSSYYPYPAPRRGVDRFIERVTLRGAASLVTTSEPFAEELSHLHPHRVDVVLNGHQASNDWDEVQRRLPGRLNLLYSGHLYSGKRDPRPLFDAIALLGAEGAGIRVHFAGPHGVEAARSAHLANCPNSLVDHGQINRAEALRLQHRADVLLLLMWNDIGDAAVFPGKLFEYLFARRPILMLGWPQGVAAELIRSRGAGVVLNDPTAIADQLRVWLVQMGSPGGIRPLPASVTEGLTREAQNRRFARVIELAARV